MAVSLKGKILLQKAPRAHKIENLPKSLHKRLLHYSKKNKAKTTLKMSIESTLTRELEIRFIDARAIATEAKLNLGIEGYVSSQDQQVAIQEEALRIFTQDKSERERMGMRILSSRLNSIKSSSSHGTSSDDEDKASSVGRRSSAASDVSRSGTSSTGSRKLKMSWTIRRR